MTKLLDCQRDPEEEEGMHIPNVSDRWCKNGEKTAQKAELTHVFRLFLIVSSNRNSSYICKMRLIQNKTSLFSLKCTMQNVDT